MAARRYPKLSKEQKQTISYASCAIQQWSRRDDLARWREIKDVEWLFDNFEEDILTGLGYTRPNLSIYNWLAEIHPAMDVDDEDEGRIECGPKNASKAPDILVEPGPGPEIAPSSEVASQPQPHLPLAGDPSAFVATGGISFKKVMQTHDLPPAGRMSLLDLARVLDGWTEAKAEGMRSAIGVDPDSDNESPYIISPPGAQASWAAWIQLKLVDGKPEKFIGLTSPSPRAVEELTRFNETDSDEDDADSGRD
ncbi:hypothetical protein CSAL01_08433 [Colletotrichum salicis]|uniref:Uncharacterized protein n=1 Tax=Colletotrichum salicis TaxID=1209931 RepID=A0A135U6U2_9PEZI|nr:hypothetical protein CSAL01_08433 [Colletotrichum salicis]